MLSCETANLMATISIATRYTGRVLGIDSYPCAHHSSIRTYAVLASPPVDLNDRKELKLT